MNRNRTILRDGTKLTFVSASTTRTIAPGLYSWGMNQMGQKWIQPNALSAEELRPINASQTALVDRLNAFWGDADKYAEIGVPHRLGALLHGKPGTGKTAACRAVTAHTVKLGGVVVSFSGAYYHIAPVVEELRGFLPKAPIVVLLEDLDTACDDVDEDTALTHAMDGMSNALSNVLILATTNSIDKLSDRLRRPGRFDIQEEIHPPTQAERTAYIAGLWKVGDDHPVVQELARSLDGHVIADIRAAAISRYMKGITVAASAVA